MGPLALLALAGTAVVVGVAASGSKDTGSSWSFVTKLDRKYPPPVPYYPPNIANAHYPLVWWAIDGQTGPVAGNRAVDVRGLPWVVQDGWATIPGSIPAVTYGDLECPAAGGEVFDVKTRTWVPCKDQRLIWVSAHWDDGSKSFGEQVTEIVVKYAVPIAISIVGATIGGIGGAAVAFALQAGYSLATGAKFTDAVVDAYQTRLASEAEKTAYYQAFNQVASAPMTQTAIVQLKNQIVKEQAPAEFQRVDVEKAVTTAIGFARAKQLQAALKTAVQSRSTPEESAWLDVALDHGVALQDWVRAMFGTPGIELMQWTLTTAGRELDAGRDPAAAIRPRTHTKVGLAKSLLASTRTAA